MELITAFAIFLVIAVCPPAGLLMAFDIEQGHALTLLEEDQQAQENQHNSVVKQ